MTSMLTASSLNYFSSLFYKPAAMVHQPPLVCPKSTRVALQRHLLNSLFSVSFLMYFNEGKEKKKCGKDKDQKTKNTLIINGGVSRGCLLLGKNTWLCSKLNSTSRSVILSPAVRLQGTQVPFGRQTTEIVLLIIIISSHTKHIQSVRGTFNWLNSYRLMGQSQIALEIPQIFMVKYGPR